ncbi:hypothetical protein GCM10011375_39870 [Hymenobacter qilianensis]|uniref:Uncharacterized protein n=2 Tax=Hymenobacter qilianensis TaxID=1385715 RepID=A0A7H0H1F3_9BACT|nr:hypothetical protein [Hymenobacter qilianensis]QNP54369.1 hypothetical protein H9L05_22090 [Hymenobacter qilianensis]GGF80844.1 hypothetical protein GCM10011375_39870 [Hymenobacter qilianensis]
MFRSLFLFRRLLATSFLLVFVNVFVGQCWCATLQPVPVAPVAKALVVAEKPSHPGCQGHAKKTAQQKLAKHATAKHDSKPAGKDQDCCQDNSAAILKSLATPGEKHLVSTAPALLPASTDFFFRPAAGQWDRTHAVVLVLREHLPPKIPDIRIFIQSLTV